MGRGITLAPCGLAIEGIKTEADRLRIDARPLGMTAACPVCGTVSARIHRRSNRHGASDVIEQQDGPYSMGHDDARGWPGVCRSSA